MAELLRKQNQVIAFALETLYGDGTLATGADAILAKDMTVNMLDNNVDERNNVVSFMGAQGGTTISRGNATKFAVEFAGSGTPATPPAWGKMLRACGMGQVIGASDVTYTPIGTAFESGAILYRIAKLQQILPGARGKFTLNLDAQSTPLIGFDFMALFQDPTVEADLLSGVDLSAFKNPQGQTKDIASVTFLGTAVRMSKLSIDLGVQLQFVQDTEKEEIEIVGRQGSVSISFRTTDAELVTAIQNASNNVEGALNAVHGTTAGKTLTVNVPNLQVKTSKVSWDGEIANVDVTGDIKPLTANTDLTITQS